MTKHVDPANFSEELYRNIVPSTVSIHSQFGVESGNEAVRAHAHGLIHDINGIAASLGTMAQKAIPAGVLGAAAAAVAHMDASAAGIMMAGAGFAGTLSALSTPRGKEKPTREV